MNPGAELVEVVDYDPAWPAVFESVRADLSRILAEVDVLAIEHVGSTSVPGLAAKPVLDIDIVVARETVPAAIAAMESGGYIHLGEMGIPERHAFRPPASPRRNVYVTVEGCLALRNHLGVRDVLRSDAALRREYGELKKRLAARYTKDDIELYVELYVEGKSVVVQKLLVAAGIAANELEEIEEANRAIGPALAAERPATIERNR